jgi:hypothetical protein
MPPRSWGNLRVDRRVRPHGRPGLLGANLRQNHVSARLGADLAGAKAALLRDSLRSITRMGEENTFGNRVISNDLGKS